MALHLSFMRALSVEIPRCRIMSKRITTPLDQPSYRRIWVMA